jgi:hypothetical protein
MRTLEVKNWKKVALDRDEWAKLLKKGQSPPRAVEPMMMINTNEMSGSCSTYWDEERCIQGFGGDTCRKETTLRTYARWEDNIKIDLQKWTEGMDWIDLAPDRNM